MTNASTWVFLLAGVLATRAAAAEPAPGAPPEAPPPAAPASPEPAAAPEGGPVAAPPGAVPSPAQTGPGTGVNEPAPPPTTEVPPPPAAQTAVQRGSSVPGPPAEAPASLGQTAGTDAGVRTGDPTRTRFALELGAGFLGAGRFGTDAPGRSTQEAVDGMYGLAAMIGTRSALYGLAVEIAGLGRDHYATANGSTTVNASYRVDTLWLQGRWYFSQSRPAVYITGAAGPALPVAKATGTQPSNDPLVSPPVPFQCTESGKVGLGLAAALGMEFDIARAWSFVSDARFAGHILSSDASAFGTCAPATGSALSGTVRVGFQLRL